MRDVQHWQLPVNRGVNCALLAWFLTCHHWFWWCISTRLLALGRVIIITVIVSAWLLAFGPAYVLTAGTGAVTTTCTACGLLLDRFWPICQLWTFVVGGVLVPKIFGIGTCCPCFFWKLVTNSLIWSVLQPFFTKAFCRARVKPWLMKKVANVSVVVTWAGPIGRVR